MIRARPVGERLRPDARPSKETTVTNTTQYPHVTRAEINRRMVSGQLTPGAAQQTVTDLYSEHPDAATRIVAPDVPRGDLWSATMPTPATPARERPTTPVVVASAPTSAAPALQPAVAPTTTLGPYLAALREEKGMSRTRLGDAIGTHSGIIKTWEDEERRPSPLMVPRLASALDVDPDLLRALVEAQDAPTATTDRAPTRRRGKGEEAGRDATSAALIRQGAHEDDEGGDEDGDTLDLTYRADHAYHVGHTCQGRPIANASAGAGPHTPPVAPASRLARRALSHRPVA